VPQGFGIQDRRAQDGPTPRDLPTRRPRLQKVVAGPSRRTSFPQRRRRAPIDIRRGADTWVGLNGWARRDAVVPNRMILQDVGPQLNGANNDELNRWYFSTTRRKDWQGSRFFPGYTGGRADFQGARAGGGAFRHSHVTQWLPNQRISFKRNGAPDDESGTGASRRQGLLDCSPATGRLSSPMRGSNSFRAGGPAT